MSRPDEAMAEFNSGTRLADALLQVIESVIEDQLGHKDAQVGLLIAMDQYDSGLGEDARVAIVSTLMYVIISLRRGSKGNPATPEKVKEFAKRMFDAIEDTQLSVAQRKH